ncbi:MAG: HNH endonuclease signature motif containing protein [Bacteroidota bacterium]
MRYRYSQKELRKAVLDSFSIAEVCRKLGIKAAGGNYTTLKQKFSDWDIDISHFRGQGWNVGLKFKPNPRKPLEEILVKGSTFQGFKLKKRLLKEGLKSAQCESCELTHWLDKSIPLELHHVNGDKHDNRISNLELLCPNCHALTDNYRGKNIRVAYEKS